MPISNLASPGHYDLGRGVVLFKGDGQAGFTPGWRDLGNCNEFTYSIENEFLPHFSTLSGIKTKDKDVAVSTSITCRFTLEEVVNSKNRALHALGTLFGKSASVVNPALTNASQIDSGHAVFAAVGASNFYIPSMELDMWYTIEMDALAIGKVKGTNFIPAQIASGTAGSAVAGDVRVGVTNRTSVASGTGLVEITTAQPFGDYELDRRNGKIRFRSGGPNNLVNAVNIKALVKWLDKAGGTASNDANDNGLVVLAGLTKASVSGSLLFLHKSARTGKDMQTEFFNVTITPEGDSGFISDDWRTLTFSASVGAAVGGAPYGTGRSPYFETLERQDDFAAPASPD